MVPANIQSNEHLKYRTITKLDIDHGNGRLTLQNQSIPYTLLCRVPSLRRKGFGVGYLVFEDASQFLANFPYFLDQTNEMCSKMYTLHFKK